MQSSKFIPIIATYHTMLEYLKYNEISIDSTKFDKNVKVDFEHLGR